MEKLWVTTEELAHIKGVSARAIRKSIAAKKYCTRKNGKSYEILISTLDEETKNKIILQEPNSEKILRFKESEKQIALAKFGLVQKWRTYRNNSCKKKTSATEDFLIMYNKQLNYIDIFKNLGEVSSSSLYRWDKQLRDNNDDWYSLLNKYTPHPKQSTISKIEQEIFLSILLNPNQTNIGKAIKLTKHVLSERGINKFACDMTYRRFAEKYKKEHYDIWVFSRQGAKALRDNVIPYIERDISTIEVGDIIVGDGHRLAFEVLNPFTGKPCRPLLAAYQDWKSGALVGFEIMFEENIQCIASALRNAILTLGKIPKYIYHDNGKAFKSKYFTDDSKINGLFVKLGITPIFAKPYNAKAKVIERFFREMQDSFERLLPSFVGSCINNKPAYMKRNETFHKKMHNSYIPKIDEVINILNSWLNFHYSQECPNVRSKTIGEVLLAGKGDGVDIAKLDDLMLVTEIKNIGRNGIRFLKSDYYDESLYGLRIKVIIKYSLFDLSGIKVFDTDGNFICIAHRREPINPLANYEGNARDINELKELTKQQKRLEQQTVRNYIAGLKHQKAYLPLLNEENYEEYKSLEDNKAVMKTFEETDKREDIIVFHNQFERYEFLKQKSELSEQEKSWVEDYENTDEYKLIYG